MKRCSSELRTILFAAIALSATACTQIGLIGARPVRGNGQGYDVLACASAHEAVSIVSRTGTRIGIASITQDGGAKRDIGTKFSDVGTARTYASDDGTLSVSVDFAVVSADQKLDGAVADSASQLQARMQCSYTAPAITETPPVPPPATQLLISIYRYYNGQHHYTDSYSETKADPNSSYEGVAFHLRAQPAQQTDASMLRCLTSGSDLLTVDPACEGGTLTAKLGYLADPGDVSGTATLYRCVNGNVPADHLSVFNTSECTSSGFSIEGMYGLAFL